MFRNANIENKIVPKRINMNYFEEIMNLDQIIY